MADNGNTFDLEQNSAKTKFDQGGQKVVESAVRVSRNSVNDDSSMESMESTPSFLSSAQIQNIRNGEALFLQPLLRHSNIIGDGNSRIRLKPGLLNQYFDFQKLYSPRPFLSDYDLQSAGGRPQHAFADGKQDGGSCGGILTISGTKKRHDDDFFPDDAKEGLLNVRATTLLLLWYFFSFCTLFLNKYILSFLQGEPTLLGAIQMVCTTCLGFVQMYIPCGLYRPVERKGQPHGFWRNMALVGSMRFSTVVLGLFALKYISVSFTETVKSTAPLFTVIIAWLVLRDKCGIIVLGSLVPVMGGLALCSAYELSFHLIGFSAAVGTNLMDCLQNVFSKLLISGDDYKYTPAELQFYTSVASIVVQIPASFFVMDFYHAEQDLHSGRMFAALLTNGLCFHLQSITAYALMGYISPVTHSVANTAKRAILIWLSVLVFGNEVTVMSAAGTAMVLVGVLLYNKAREHELQRQRRNSHLSAIAGEGPYHHRIV